jgi:hypothetical protein
MHEENGVLHVEMSGPASLQEVIRLWREVLDACAARKLQKALVNCLGVEGSLSTLERYEVGLQSAKYAAELGINPWVAIIGKPPMVDGLAALVANNRGTRAEVFADGPAAIEWLRALGGLGNAGDLRRRQTPFS